MTQLHLTQNVVKDITKNEITALDGLQDREISSNNFYYQPLDGKAGLKIYGQKTTTVKERNDFLVIYKNRQYQWLLAEAYEEFEDFIGNIYAYIGFKDNELWKCSDFGNITINNLKSQKYIWFQEQSKKQKIKYVLNRLRDIFSEIKEISKNNTMNVNLEVAIALIEHLRHIIVHKNGMVDKKEDFVKKVLEKVGLYNSGNPTSDNRHFIEKYFGVRNDCSLVRLLDSPTKYPGININVLKDLTDYLLAYSFFIKKIIEKKIEN